MATLKSLSFKKVLVLKNDATLYDAARAMDNKAVGSALVSDGSGHIIGLITDRDIACRGAGAQLSPFDEIGKLVRGNLIFIGENRTLTEATQIMQYFGIRRLPVIKTGSGGKSRCIGILSFDDLVASESVPIEELAEIIKNQLPSPKKRAAKKTAELYFMPKELQPISAF